MSTKCTQRSVIRQRETVPYQTVTEVLLSKMLEYTLGQLVVPRE